MEAKMVDMDTVLSPEDDHSRKRVTEAVMVIDALLSDRYPDLSCSLVVLHGTIAEHSIRGLPSPILMESVEKSLETIFTMFKLIDPEGAKRFLAEKMLKALTSLEAKAGMK